MDQGIIKNLKCLYKKILLRRRLEAMDMGRSSSLHCSTLYTLSSVLGSRSASLQIRNCFAKAKFSEEEYQSEPDDAELLEIWEALPAEEKIHENKEIELFDFLEADERLETGGSFTLEDIAEEMLSREKPVESEDDEVTVEEETISFENAQQEWSTVRKFMPQRSEKLGVMQACNCLENEMREIRRKNMRQLTILQSFGLS